MQSIFDDLDEKKKELENYLDLIDYLDSTNLLLNDANEIFNVSSNLVKTAKGTVYLLLYNLIEATMREAVLVIHEKIASNNIRFDHLRIELQRKILLRARKDKIDLNKMLRNMNGDIASTFHKASLNSKDLFSGNIDRDEIVTVGGVYGFSCNTDYSKTKHGSDLVTVMRHRNDLSHGNKTFSNIGGEKSAQALRQLCEEIVAYIYEIADNIQDSLDNQDYLQAVPQPTP
ncbi:MAE_28990/MAE_18760 family HEPN-like nuclease [Vibrio jasicida]|uniref:MAE_28990/MAE_18760 family HEPN-like nuclease n=1 Tax=Vibrio jasicida TaxID=766224 RepID=UPI00039D3892|nr:MAE_28990/MAE_18760 family HEPN-like nuclease [Vibrio jasicida]